MTKQIQTFYDHVNHCNDSVILLRHIAKMMALQQPEYTDEYVTDELSDAIAQEMLYFAHKNRGQNFEVTCSYAGVTESSTFRSMELFGFAGQVHDTMGIEEYMEKVVRPVSQELAERIARKIGGPLTETKCDIKVGLA